MVTRYHDQLTNRSLRPVTEARFAPTGTPLAGVTILLDPGHGGTDPGAASVPYNRSLRPVTEARFAPMFSANTCDWPL